MRKSISILLLTAAFGGLTSCQTSKLGFDDKIRLSSTAMSFTQEGAEIGECGLMSQFDKGRASSSNSAGGG